MTTAKVRKALDYCEGCEGTKLCLNAAGYCPICAEKACSTGDGEAVGLPSIPNIDIFKVRLLLGSTTDGFVRDLVNGPMICTECDTDVREMGGFDLRNHFFGPVGTILIGCEGYHTALMRAGAKLVLGLRP